MDFIRFQHKHPLRESGVGETRAYLSYLDTKKDVADSTQNVAFPLLVYLYRQVLRLDLQSSRTSNGIGERVLPSRVSTLRTLANSVSRTNRRLSWKPGSTGISSPFFLAMHRVCYAVHGPFPAYHAASDPMGRSRSSFLRFSGQ